MKRRLWILIYTLNLRVLDHLTPGPKIVLIAGGRRYAGAIRDWQIYGDEVVGMLQELDAQS
jgi:hypothetical protein